MNFAIDVYGFIDSLKMIIYVEINLINQKTKLLALEISCLWIHQISNCKELTRQIWVRCLANRARPVLAGRGTRPSQPHMRMLSSLALSLALENIKLPSAPNHFYNKTINSTTSFVYFFKSNPFPLIYLWKYIFPGSNNSTQHLIFQFDIHLLEEHHMTFDIVVTSLHIVSSK